MADRVNVDAAGGDIRRDHGAAGTGLEGRKGPFALGLALIAVDGCSTYASGLQRLGHAVGTALGAGEDNSLVDFGFFEQFRQQGTLAVGLHEDNALVDTLDGRAGGGYRNLDRVFQ